MRVVSHYRSLLATSGLLIAFGFSKLLDQLVLGDWQVISAGEFDLAARGIWLLAAFSLVFSFTGAFLSVVFVAVTRRTDEPLTGRIMAGALGSVVGAALFGADPVQYLLGLPHWHSGYAYHVVTACAGLAILALGIFLLVRIARAMRTEPAAA